MLELVGLLVEAICKLFAVCLRHGAGLPQPRISHTYCLPKAAHITGAP
jgi:hypothetical protein